MNQKSKRMMLIYFSGYSTHKDWTLAEWFEAKEYVLANKNLVPTFR